MELWNGAIESKGFTIRGCSVRASLEASPRRKLQYRNANAAQNALFAVGITTAQIEICHRSLQVVGTQTHVCVGSTPYASGNWAWKKEGLVALGITASSIERLLESPLS